MDYPGLVGLFLTKPYEHYVGAAWGQLGEMDRELKESAENRARYKRGERVPITKGMDIQISQAVDGTFDGAESIGYSMKDLWKNGINPEVSALQALLPGMKDALANANTLLNDPEVKLYLKRNPFAAVSAGARKTALEKAIAKWELLISHAITGQPTAEPDVAAPEEEPPK